MQVQILRSEQISPTAKLYECRAEEECSFLPGQFISFLIPRASGKQSVRAYSFCSDPSTLPLFELCVRQVEGGIGTDYLRQNVGQTVKTSLPQGEFVLPEHLPDTVVFIASGTGIAPVRSQLQFVLKKRTRTNFYLHYRFREEQEFLFQSEVERMAGDHSNFYLSADEEIDPGIYEDYQGKKPTFFVVGPPSFVKQHTDKLMQLGYSNGDVIIDIWE